MKMNDFRAASFFGAFCVNADAVEDLRDKLRELIDYDDLAVCEPVKESLVELDTMVQMFADMHDRLRDYMLGLVSGDSE